MTAFGAFLVFFALGAQSPPGASISGRVTDGTSGQPVPRMVVVAAVSADPRKMVQATTDADGRYEISGLPPGSYAVGVSHDEHRATYLPQWFGSTTPAQPFAPPPRLSVDVTQNERRTGVDVALTRALAIEGRITDPWDDPLGEVEVFVMRTTGPVAASAPADDRGMYRLFGLPPGRYRVCVHPRDSMNIAPPGDAPTMVRTCHPSAPTEAEASEVTLTAQDAIGIDIRVQRVGGRTVAGTVVDAAGLPVDGADVMALPSDRASPAGRATTHAGAFVMKGLVPGRYTVRASIGGSRHGDIDSPSREREMGDALVDLAVDATSVTIALTKAVAVRGRITFEGGAPPPAARMTVAARGDDPLLLSLWSRPPEGPVKSDLTFELPEMFRTPVTLAIQDLPDGWALKAVRLEGRDITYVPTDFTLVPGGRLELVLTSDVARPSLRLIDDRGEAATAAQALVLPADPARWRQWTPPAPRQSAEPSTTIWTLLPGDYLVAALSIDDYYSLLRERSHLDAVARVATRITVEKGDRRTIALAVVPLPDR